jgi:hypothetical protein
MGYQGSVDILLNEIDISCSLSLMLQRQMEV